MTQTQSAGTLGGAHEPAQPPRCAADVRACARAAEATRDRLNHPRMGDDIPRSPDKLEPGYGDSDLGGQ
jgi:hypothetical protein